MESKNAELKAGLVVLGAALAFMFLLFVATGEGLWGDWRHVHMRVEIGKLSPRKGDPIFANGVKIGSVEHVELRTEVRLGDQMTPGDLLEWEKLVAKGLAREDQTPQIREVYVHVVGKLREDQII